MATPSDYGLDHDEFRPGQESTIDKVLSMGGGQVAFLEAPTGSGKTAIARAAGATTSVTALCKTNALQEANYEINYGFDPLYGRGNYPCSLDSSVSAGLCEYAEIGMHKCPSSDVCQYLVQKAEVKASMVRSLNYAYWMTARWPKQEMTDYLFLDEAHLLSEIVLDRVGCTITDADRKEWGLPNFPSISTASTGMMLTQVDPYDEAICWLEKARSRMQDHWRVLSKKVKVSQDKDTKKKFQKCEQLGYKIKATLDGMQLSRGEWYIVSGPRAQVYGRQRRPAFIARPLTARHHFPAMFLGDWKTVAMSATIGDFDTFAEELGINGYIGIRVENQWAPEQRPVYYHPDAPRIGRGSSDKDYDKQAQLIAGMLREVPSEWSGIIHTVSKAQTMAIANRLARNGLQNRIWPMPQKHNGKWLGTNEQLALWHQKKQSMKGAIMVAWSMWEGIDLLEEKVNIVAKTPFGFLGDPYEKARMRYSGKFYLQRTAWQLEQGLGRTRRGRPQDYDTENEKRGLVAILDGNFTRCKKYMSAGLQEALVQW
jgi:Rad3-related DNA helicase